LSPKRYQVNGCSIVVVRTSANACTVPVANALLLPVVYSVLAVVALAVWLKVVPIAKFCVIGALKSIVMVCPGFKVFK